VSLHELLCADWLNVCSNKIPYFKVQHFYICYCFYFVLSNSFKVLFQHALLNKVHVQNLSYQQRTVFIHYSFSMLH